MKAKDVYSVLCAATLVLCESCSDEKSTGPAKVPVLSTADVTEIRQTSALCGGTVTSDGGATVTVRGVCWSTSLTPTVDNNKTEDGAGTGSFLSSLTGLTGKTTYYVAAYATNSAGTGYGGISSFVTTDSMDTVTDIDGNVYRTVKIGNQWWMMENLKVTHFRDGAMLPEIADLVTWFNLTTGAFCNYGNDSANVTTYGRLYNWYAVTDGHNIAPAGWHVPSDAEWQTLINYLGGDSLAGGRMKEAGSAHWAHGNIGANNESGFSALPGGDRTWDDSDMSYGAYFWSSTEGANDGGWSTAWSRQLYYGGSEIYRNDVPKQWGFSVRCVKN